MKPTTRAQSVHVLAPLMLALLAGQPCSGQVLWNESIQGDLSGDRFNPTPLSLAVGASTLSATTGGGDLEYITFAVPAGSVLSSIVLNSYAGPDGTAFFGLQQGSTFTESPSSPNVGNLLGWTHFGTGPGNVGADVLPGIGTGGGAQGFTPPLGTDTYAVWLQQLGSPATYQFTFSVAAVPEPTETAVAVGALLVGVAVVRRRRAGRAASA